MPMRQRQEVQEMLSLQPGRSVIAHHRSSETAYWRDVPDPAMTGTPAGQSGDQAARRVRTASGQGMLGGMNDQVTAQRKRHRVEVRVNPQQDALIRQAADLENTTVTAFVLDSVTARAQQVVRRHRDLVLANEDFDRFIAELDKPAAPVPELAALFERHPKLPEA